MKQYTNTPFFILLSALILLSSCMDEKAQTQESHADSIHLTSSPNQQSLHYEVNLMHRPLAVTKERLLQAQTLTDLNEHYEADWVKEYISVTVSAQQNGSTKTVMGTSENLNQAQKDLMKAADANTKISISVEYVPENNLKQNEAKEMGFSFPVEAEKEAQFEGGEQGLQQYLQEAAINKIPKNTFKGYDLAAVKFTVSTTGQVSNVQLFNPSPNEEVDQILLEAIREMPKWLPAEYANGLKVEQDFALTVGNMENCMVNLLNI